MRPSQTILLAVLALVISASQTRRAGADEMATQAPTRQLYAILFQPGPAWRAGAPMEQQDLRPHGLYYRDLLAAGRIHAGGRLGQDNGLAIIWAADEAEAQAILRDDPAITSGIFTGEVRLWRPRFRSPDPLPAQ